jgi:hypothetical protein
VVLRELSVVEQRCQAVLTVLEDGLSVTEAAAKVNRPGFSGEPSRLPCRSHVGCSCGLNGSVVSLLVLGWGSIPSEPCRRRWLYRSTQPAVANSMSTRVL